MDKNHSKRMSLREDSSLYLLPRNLRLEPTKPVIFSWRRNRDAPDVLPVRTDQE